MREEHARVSREEALIAQIASLIGSPIGDDVAVWQPSRSHRSVVTSDALVEGVHFRRDLMSLHDAGYRAMASNLSDLAAAGARPVPATVSLGIPAQMSGEDVMTAYRGIAECAAAHKCRIAGGDTTRADVFVIAITAVGEVRATNFKGRSGARPGDVIALTGPLGAARAGLMLAGLPGAEMSGGAAAALDAFRNPKPRLREGKWLAASANVHAMMDLSDGFSTDLARMCERSQCGALVESVPAAACVSELARDRGWDEREIALSGGEEFELLVAVAPRAFAHLAARFSAQFGKPLLRAGTFRQGSAVAIRNRTDEEPLAATGWDALA